MKIKGLACLLILGSTVLPRAQDLQISVTVRTTCEAMIQRYCQGAFGFNISPEGHWRAGPDPASGRIQEGQITSEELLPLRITTDRVFSLDAVQRQNCSIRPILPGVSETVVLMVPSQWAVTLRGEGGKIDPSCGAANSDYGVTFNLADELMRRYYPRPF
jgi:hypothetical protein